MLQIMCMVDPEDYWYIHSMHEQNQVVNYYGYLFVAEDETQGTNNKPAKVMVIELINANLALGFAVSSDFNMEGKFKIAFICYEKPDPSDSLPLEVKLSNEVKKTKLDGTETEKLEYIGFSLEKFYEQKNVKFYMQDLRAATSK